MGSYLDQVTALSEKHHVPVICGGDVFHKWDSSAELINFALRKLPKMYAVPGQHDLPLHNYQDIRKSAFYTLVEAGRVILLDPYNPISVGALRLHGFPWGFPVTPLKERSNSLLLEVAVIHAYIWKKGCSYPNAPRQKRVKNWVKKIRGYDHALFGDNHIGFSYRNVFNSGTFMRMRSDEVGYRPRVGLLMSDGMTTPHYLDCEGDKFLDGKKAGKLKVGEKKLGDFLAGLRDLKDVALNFREAVVRHMEGKNTPEGIKRIVLSAMEDLT